MLTSLASPEIYRVLLDSMKEGVSLSDEDGVIIYTNAAEDALFGYEAGELIGLHVSVQNAHPEAENLLRVQEVIEHLKVNGSWEGDWLNKRKDGSSFVTASRITAVQIDGRPHWLCVQRDTPERLILEALKESEKQTRDLAQRLNLALDAGAIRGTWVWDIASDTVRADTRFADTFGIPRDQASLGFPIERAVDAIHPDDRTRVSRAIKGAVEQGGSYRTEYRVRDAKGEYRWVEASGQVESGPDGRAAQFPGVAVDIQARKQAEARFRGVFESALMGFTIFDANSGQTLAVNDSFLSMTGHTRADFEEGRWDWRDFTVEDHLALDEIAIAQARERGSWQTYEKEYVRRDGTRFPVRLSSAPLPNEPGRVVVGIEDITAERAAQSALRDSEAQLRRGLQAARMVVWSYDLQNGAVTRSENADEIFGPGSTPEAFIQRMPTEDSEADRARLEAAISGVAARYESEFRYRHPDGRLMWLFNQGQLERNPQGAALRLHGVCLDVTARKQAELELKALNETLEQRIAEALAERKLLADLVEGTDAFVQVVDPNFHWLAINKAAADEFERIFGLRPKVGDSMLDLLAGRPEHRAAVQDIWSRALEGEAFTEIGVFGDPALARRHYEMKYNPLRGPNGQLIGAYQFVYDVTARVEEQRRLAEAEAARRDSDALYRAYFENTPEALFVIGVEQDGGFVVEEINPAHEAGVGLKLEEIRGKRIEDILPEAAARRVLETYRHVVATGAIYQYREEFDLNGCLQHWDTSLVPMLDEHGRIVRVIGSSRNVTRQVVAEEALRQSQKMEAMGQLTGGVAHDFNNLLTPIVGALDMLQRKGLGGEREQRLIAGAAQSADRAKTLVQRLLAFARRQPLQPVSIDVAKLVEGMAELISSTTGPQIKVVVDAGSSLPPAKADPNQLEMAVLNLAVNARDAMPEGGMLRISVEAATVGRQHRAQLKPGRYVLISVADTGAGMDEATLARAVEPFFSTKGVGKGTGLGLSMVHGLALQLGGAISISSTVGVGTNVELWLPQGDRASEVPGEASSQQLDLVGRGIVLLVDDEDVVRLSTADMLIDMGYHVVEASSAEEALRLLNRGLSPQLVITDHLMPGMSGTDLARKLQTERAGTKVLVISGYAEAAGIAPDLPRLPKPFKNSELADCIAALQ